MAIVLRAILLSLLGWSIEAKRVKSVMSTFKISAEGDDCSHLITRSGHSVSCTVVKRLGGGRQANTNIVNISGDMYVMKETSDPNTVANLRHERKIVERLQAAGFTKMPRYYLAFQAKQHRSETLIMEFLHGWFDLNSGVPAEEPGIREVRTAAFFLALNDMYKGSVSHCDLNPGNVMFNRNDPTLCKIIDFGMAEVNWGLPGTCNAMNGMPDLGYDGAAWKQINAALRAPRGPGTIFSACGSRCDTQMQWKNIVSRAEHVLASYQQRHGQRHEEMPASSLPPVQNRPVARSGDGEIEPARSQETSPSSVGMVTIDTREFAEQIKHGMVVEYEGAMGKAMFPKIIGPSLTFNFEADDGQSRHGIRVFWASNKGKLKAAI